MLTVLVVLLAIAAYLFFVRKSDAPSIEEFTKTPPTTSTTSLAHGSYTLDTSSSKIGWYGEKIIGSSEKGTVKLSSGSFTFGSTTSGKFVIDMNSIASEPHIEMLVKHLKSDDFFSVEKYPTAVFELSSITTASEANKYNVTGLLTIKGITKNISFPANILVDGNNVRATGALEINRADWQVRYGSPSFFNDLGDKAIKDNILLTIDLLATKVIQ